MDSSDRTSVEGRSMTAILICGGLLAVGVVVVSAIHVLSHLIGDPAQKLLEKIPQDIERDRTLAQACNHWS
jgi:hypothetical protein